MRARPRPTPPPRATRPPARARTTYAVHPAPRGAAARRTSSRRARRGRREQHGRAPRSRAPQARSLCPTRGRNLATWSPCVMPATLHRARNVAPGRRDRMQILGPFHPQIVHFPIVLIICSVVFDLVGRATDSTWWRKASMAMLVVGVAAGVLAILTGEFVGDRAEELQKLPEATVDGHGDVAKLAIWIAGGALLARLVEAGLGATRSLVSVLAVLLQLASAVTIGVAAHRGGMLVYRHAAGVTVDGKLIRAAHTAHETRATQRR